MSASRLAYFRLPRSLRHVASAALFGLLAVPCTLTHAEDFALSIAGGAADGRVDCLDGFACDHHAGYFKVGAAYRGFDPLELQVAYFHVGDLKGADTTPLGTKFGGTFRLEGVALTAGYRWAFAPDFDLVARGGVAGVRAGFVYDPPFSGEPSKTTAEPFGALNLQYAIAPAWRVGLDYDLTRLKAHVTRGTLQMIGASVQFNF